MILTEALVGILIDYACLADCCIAKDDELHVLLCHIIIMLDILY